MSLIEQEPIIVVGAGWAGLTTALTLSRLGYRVIVLEAAPQAGGRARKISFGEDTVDNGQHLLLGAYHHVLTVLQWLEVPEQSLLYRIPLELWISDLNQPFQPFHIRMSKSTSGSSRLINLFSNLKGLTWRERFKIIQFCYTTWLGPLPLSAGQDMSVQELLVLSNQPETLITKLWAPIALAALSTPIHEASAQVFLRVLKDTFLKDRTSSDLLFPKTDLSELLPNPILRYLNHHNNTILYNQRVKSLMIKDGQCEGVCTATQQFKGQHVVLATPPHVSAQLLLQSNAAFHCKSLIEDLFKFQYQPITTIYLRYKSPAAFKIPMIGLVNSTAHWVFDRQLTGNANILSVVITGGDVHSSLDHAQLVTKVAQELVAVFPELKQVPLEEYRVICEKRAAFACHVGVNHYRPTHKTPVSKLWLAGDHTQTHYPATLEGAVMSGMQVAMQIHE